MCTFFEQNATKIHSAALDSRHISYPTSRGYLSRLRPARSYGYRYDKMTYPCNCDPTAASHSQTTQKRIAPPAKRKQMRTNIQHRAQAKQCQRRHTNDPNLLLLCTILSTSTMVLPKVPCLFTLCCLLPTIVEAGILQDSATLVKQSLANVAQALPKKSKLHLIPPEEGYDE